MSKLFANWGVIRCHPSLQRGGLTARISPNLSEIIVIVGVGIKLFFQSIVFQSGTPYRGCDDESGSLFHR